MQERYLVEHVGEPLTLLFPVKAQAPDGVAQGFLAHGHLRGKCLLAQVHQRTTDGEALGEFVLPVYAKHGFALHAVFGVRLERHVHVGARIDNALIQDGYLTSRIIYRIIGAFGKYHATCRYHHRTMGHVHGTQRNDIGRRAFILAHQHVLILLGYQLGHRLG